MMRFLETVAAGPKSAELSKISSCRARNCKWEPAEVLRGVRGEGRVVRNASSCVLQGQNRNGARVCSGLSIIIEQQARRRAAMNVSGIE